MKGIVADLVVGTHGENRLPGRSEGFTKKLNVFGSPGIVSICIRSFVCQTCRQLLADKFCNRSSVTGEACKPRTQRALTRHTQFAADRVIVIQIERA